LIQHGLCSMLTAPTAGGKFQLSIFPPLCASCWSIRISPMYLVSHLTAPKLGVVLLGDAGELTQHSDFASQPL